MQKSQILKGLLEGSILKIISHGETYGYEITSELSQEGFDFINEASVYTVLMRLTKKGYIIGEQRKSELGPKRKYFRITPEGTQYLKSFEEDWFFVSERITSILKGGTNNEK